MQINDLFHGFRVKSVTPLDEIKAKMWRMEYEKNGADLVWFEREDANANMTFGIAFKTVPEDDTGVFHIIEHSVLCGSDKYPAKEPFADLIKSSVNTFLNAMTYNDKTVYPVSSRNRQDFLNLMDVYLDAVFHPLSLRRPLAFLQEGWHYEFDETGTPSYNGVVFSEMKGAYANAGRILDRQLNRALFPDNCYGKDSGGCPESIPDLTWERYCENLRKYYSAANARIFLDGILDTDAVFGKLDAFLSEYDRIDADFTIPMQSPVEPPLVTARYPIGADEDPKGKALLADGWVFGTFDEIEKASAANLLTAALAENNESPVKKAVLNSGLCEDMSLYVDYGIQQTSVRLTFRNTEPAHRKALTDIVYAELRKQMEEGVDPEELEARLTSWEFSLREEEDPLKGLSVGLSSLDTWLYGGDPAQPFHNNEIVENLRKKLHDGSRYYENLIREIFFDCRHHAAVDLLPSPTMGEEQNKAEAARVQAAAAAFSPAERQKAEDDLAELRRFQNTEDSEEDRAKLPVLRLSDLTDRVPPVRAELTRVAGCETLRNPQFTNGIVYCDLWFSMEDLDEEELHRAELLRLMWADLGTARHSTQEIFQLEQRDLGNIASTTSIRSDHRPSAAYQTQFGVRFSVLESKLDRALELVTELILETDYRDGEEILNHVRQDILDKKNDIRRNGTAWARKRVNAQNSEAGHVTEVMKGLEHLRWEQALLDRMEKEGTGFAEDFLCELAARLFVRSRLKCCITGHVTEDWLTKLIDTLPEGKPAAEKCRIGTLPRRREGIEIPAQVGFAVLSGTFPDSFRHTGADAVASTVLSTEYLWNEIRVKGGAYGTGMSIDGVGSVSFSSYRDPQPGKSLETFLGAGRALREAADGEFENFVISTYGSALPMITPYSETGRAADLWQRHLPFDTYSRFMEQIVATDRASLYRIADMLDSVLPDAAVCVVGGPEQLKACGEKLQKITKIF